MLDETMGFATSSMHGFDVVRRKVWDTNPEDCEEFEVLEGGYVYITLTRAERDALHMYVLRNNTLTTPYYMYVYRYMSMLSGVWKIKTCILMFKLCC